MYEIKRIISIIVGPWVISQRNPRSHEKLMRQSDWPRLPFLNFSQSDSG